MTGHISGYNNRRPETRVTIPVGKPLKLALDAAKWVCPMILTTTDDTPWTEAGFRVELAKVCKRIGVSGVTFNDLRGTAVTRLAIAEASVPEIATFTGHSQRDVQAILDAHYLHRDPAMAKSALRKLETRTKIPD